MRRSRAPGVHDLYGRFVPELDRGDGIEPVWRAGFPPGWPM